MSTVDNFRDKSDNVFWDPVSRQNKKEEDVSSLLIISVCNRENGNE